MRERFRNDSTSFNAKIFNKLKVKRKKNQIKCVVYKNYDAKISVLAHFVSVESVCAKEFNRITKKALVTLNIQWFRCIYSSNKAMRYYKETAKENNNHKQFL